MTRFTQEPGEKFPFEVGDEFEGTPAEVSRFISFVMGVGGQVTVDGDSAKIVLLPAEVTGAKVPKLKADETQEGPGDEDSEPKEETPKKRGRPSKAESDNED